MFDTLFTPWTQHAGLALWLPLIWAALIGISVAMYVVMDGFDLGIGILFNAAHSENWRDRMMFSVAPIWDGNETWLILGGGGLFAAFHLAYAILMPALYVPLFTMLIALVFRGVAFEFRFKANASKRIWDYAFSYGSLIATFSQGVVLGTFVQGFNVRDNAFAGGTFDFLTPYSMATGVALVIGYGLLGSTWCVMKTTGDLERWARRLALRYLLGVVLAMAAISVWTLFLGLHIQDRWFVWPNVLFTAPVPVVTGLVALGIFRSLRNGHHVWPFLLSIALFLLGFLGLAISLFPYVVTPALTFWDAANTVHSQMFLIVGFAVVIPLTFLYTGYAYWVFRGKVAEDIQAGGYH